MTIAPSGKLLKVPEMAVVALLSITVNTVPRPENTAGTFVEKNQRAANPNCPFAITLSAAGVLLFIVTL